MVLAVCLFGKQVVKFTAAGRSPGNERKLAGEMASKTQGIIATVALCACLLHSQSLTSPPQVLYPDPFKTYPRTLQMATISDIGTTELIPGSRKIKVRVLFIADSHWLYACSGRSRRYVRNLNRGDRVSIRIDEHYVHLKVGGKDFSLRLISASPWSNL